MNVVLYLIKTIYQYNYYIKYSKYIDLEFIKSNQKDLFKLLSCVILYHQSFPDKNIASTSDLEVFFYTQYPASNTREKDGFSILFKLLDELVIDPDLAEAYVKSVKERQDGNRIALLGLDIAQGQKDWKTAVASINEVLEGSSDRVEVSDPFVSSSLSEIQKHYSDSTGLRWPLDCLNKSMGSLRKGDYGFIFARPETGKTTFVSHVAAYMASQSDLPVIWFNNEQEGHVVQSYAYRSVLGLTSSELYAKTEANENEYHRLIKDKIRIYDSAVIHRQDVEDILRRYGASLIIFDQIDKIRGFDSDRNDLELGAIYQWAREIAKRYSPVIGVCQAGESGANKRYLSMEDVVNAKTSKQAEADWILGIGKLDQDGYKNVRFLSLCKNKLVGDSDTIPQMRHGKMEVLIDQERARYKDIS